jgi:hypothetical protein
MHTGDHQVVLPELVKNAIGVIGSVTTQDEFINRHIKTKRLLKKGVIFGTEND